MLTALASVLLGITCLAHVGTIAAVIGRFRGMASPPPPVPDSSLVSVVRPICGLENNLEACLASTFRLTYPNYEVIFCADDADDPAVALARRVIAANPQHPGAVAIGRDRISGNPKLNNTVKGWRAAKADWIVISDSNTLLPPDYIERLRAMWTPNTGCVSAMVEIGATDGFASEVEAAFMNSFHARWVWAADSLGLGFAMGKTLMFHRPTLESLGGLPRLGEAAAEDIATTHLLREAGLDIHLSQRTVQPIGRRTFAAVLSRQFRWARLRRAGLRAIYAAEILNGGLVPFVAAVVLAAVGALPWWAVPAIMGAWYALEILLIRAAGWPLSWRTPLALIVRDILLSAIWVSGLTGNRFEWRGNAMTVSKAADGEQALEAETAKR